MAITSTLSNFIQYNNTAHNLSSKPSLVNKKFTELLNSAKTDWETADNIAALFFFALSSSRTSCQPNFYGSEMGEKNIARLCIALTPLQPFIDKLMQEKWADEDEDQAELKESAAALLRYYQLAKQATEMIISSYDVRKKDSYQAKLELLKELIKCCEKFQENPNEDNLKNLRKKIKIANNNDGEFFNSNSNASGYLDIHGAQASDENAKLFSLMLKHNQRISGLNIKENDFSPDSLISILQSLEFNKIEQLSLDHKTPTDGTTILSASQEALSQSNIVQLTLDGLSIKKEAMITFLEKHRPPKLRIFNLRDVPDEDHSFQALVKKLSEQALQVIYHQAKLSNEPAKQKTRRRAKTLGAAEAPPHAFRLFGGHHKEQSKSDSAIHTRHRHSIFHRLTFGCVQRDDQESLTSRTPK